MGEKNGESDFIKWFSELTNKDVSIAGGKGASLAEMYRNNFPVPPGFIVTAQAYSYFIEKSGLGDKIKSVLNDLDVEDTVELEKASKEIRHIIDNAKMPKEMEDSILEAYEILDVNKQQILQAQGTALKILQQSHEPPFVAVRSSATTEDLADASFAGQQDTFLNVKGGSDLVQMVKECFSSLFTARAIYYRKKKGFSHEKSQLAVVVQVMINSDKSGVIFSQNPVSKDDTIVIEAVWGLGEGIVSGMIKPDTYIIKRDLSKFSIVSSSISEKKKAVTRNSSGNTQVVNLTQERGMQQVLTNYELMKLARYAMDLESHYGKPQDIEFSIEGNEIYIVQSRPITTLSIHKEKEDIEGKVILSGLGASPGVASGVVKIVKDLAELNKIKKGDVLVTVMTNPDMVVTMQKAAAIVTDEGGLTSHASIVSREMGIPAVVGTGNATEKLRDGQIVTVDGYNGVVLDGKGHQKIVEIKPIVPTRTKIKVIVDLPHFAHRAALTKANAVGLVRLEGIIASSGKHPLMFEKKEKLTEYFSVIYHGLKKISEHFSEIWIRTSDIRSDEYRNLEGAPKDVEGNPMLGDHGIRFSLKHKGIFESEIRAVKALAEEFSDKIFGIMIPQVISVEELRQTKSIMKDIGIPGNLKTGIMVETPAAVQIIRSLCEEGIDFVSLGTNDLTQYILAIDRNNSSVQDIYSEMHPAVISAIKHVIRVTKQNNVESSICGQAGSKEEMVRFLVNEGIDSISVNADVAHSISQIVASIENGSYIEPTPLVSFDRSEKSNNRPVIKARALEVPVIVSATEQDIEDVLLKELEADYIPGLHKRENDIPSLNDAIPIESEHFKDEIDLVKEWDIASFV